MSRLDNQQGLMPSLLDRLIDPGSEGTAARHGYGIAQVVAAVHRDLEELLNTRQVLTDIPPACAELLRSVAVYGMPDLASVQAITSEQRGRIGRLLESVLLRFEPRLRSV